MAALVAAMPAAASVTAAAPPAAAQGKPAAAVVLTQITPQVPKRADTLQISGYISNTGETEVGPLTVHLERALSPFTERSTFDAFADGTQDHTTIAVEGSQVELNGTVGPGDLDPFACECRWRVFTSASGDRTLEVRPRAKCADGDPHFSARPNLVK
jgi:hypothetical protein